MPQHDVSPAIDVAQRLCRGLGQVIFGRDDTIQLVVAALLADGHVLIEDYPGSGKTTLTKALGCLITKDGQERDPQHIQSFRRIQFTPDMLPGDVLGVNVFEPKTGTFRFLYGPVFAHIVLADEINRTGPKVQSAFLECMAEKQVTVDNVTHPLDPLFFVVGTQNPLDVAGTYPLPIVQLDRFLIKIPMSYVDRATEISILSEHAHISERAQHLDAVCTRSEILRAQMLTRTVEVGESLRRAIVDLVQATRSHSLIQFGASTRGALMLQAAMRGWALVNGRGYATEDDLREMAPFVLKHRLRFHGGREQAEEAFAELLRPRLERLARA